MTTCNNRIQPCPVHGYRDFSDFMRNGTVAEKEEVFRDVAQKASEEQRTVIAEALEKTDGQVGGDTSDSWVEELRSLWQTTREHEGKYQKVKDFIREKKSEWEKAVHPGIKGCCCDVCVIRMAEEAELHGKAGEKYGRTQALGEVRKKVTHLEERVRSGEFGTKNRAQLLLLLSHLTEMEI